MTAAEYMASRPPRPAVERDKPFIPSRYAELRSQAVETLRRAIAAYCKDDPSELARSVVEGDRVLREIDKLWLGR